MGEKLDDRKLKFSFWYVVIALIVLTLIRSVVGGLIGTASTEISYTAFKQAVEAGRVAAVQVDEQGIDGLMLDGSPFTTARVDDPALLADLERSGVEVHGVRESNGGVSTILGWILPLVVMVGFWYWMLKRMRSSMGGGGLLSFGKSKARVVQGEQTGVTFRDVGGIGEAITDLREITDFLKDPQRFGRLGGKMPKGVLLVGPPGTGKTLLARATAGEAGVPFFSLSGAEFVEMYVGVGASRVRDLFEQAKKRAPAIIFIDEIDAIGGRRGGAGAMPTNEEREQTLNQLLAEMDGFEPTAGLMLIAATNRPEILDPALQRPGRFDRQVVVGLPDLEGRREILAIHTASVVLDSGVGIDTLARITPGFSGADLANVVNEAALLASRAGKQAVEAGDFDEAVEKVLAGSQHAGRAINAVEKRAVAVHEAGHAIAASLLEGAEPVHKVTIIPRGKALGYTWQRPTEERYLLDEDELANRLAVLLAGRSAESIVLGRISTGAADDLGRAAELARRMVIEYGMSPELGPLRLAGEPGAYYLGTGGDLRPGTSPETASAVDRETRRIVVEQLDRVTGLLERYRTALDSLSEELCETETVSGGRVSEILRIAGDAGARELVHGNGDGQRAI